MCDGTKITFKANIVVNGSYAMSGATIMSAGVGTNSTDTVNMIFDSDVSSLPLTYVTCGLTDTCYVECNRDACHYVILKCDGFCIVNCEGDDAECPMQIRGDYQPFVSTSAATTTTMATTTMTTSTKETTTTTGMTTTFMSSTMSTSATTIATTEGSTTTSTMKPTSEPTEAPVDSQSSNNDGSKNDDSDWEFSIIFFGVLGAVLVVCVAVIVGFTLYMLKVQSMKKAVLAQNSMMRQEIQIPSPSAANENQTMSFES